MVDGRSCWEALELGPVRRWLSGTPTTLCGSASRCTGTEAHCGAVGLEIPAASCRAFGCAWGPTPSADEEVPAKLRRLPVAPGLPGREAVLGLDVAGCGHPWFQGVQEDRPDSLGTALRKANHRP